MSAAMSEFNNNDSTGLSLLFQMCQQVDPELAQPSQSQLVGLDLEFPSLSFPPLHIPTESMNVDALDLPQASQPLHQPTNFRDALRNLTGVSSSSSQDSSLSSSTARQHETMAASKTTAKSTTKPTTKAATKPAAKRKPKGKGKRADSASAATSAPGSASGSAAASVTATPPPGPEPVCAKESILTTLGISKSRFVRKQPVPQDFATPEAFSDAWEAWRALRKKNNAAVQKSRAKARVRKQTAEQVQAEQQKDNARLKEEADNLRKNVVLLLKSLKGVALTDGEQMWLNALKAGPLTPVLASQCALCE
eukprot:m.192379 g.192379  ORF g.192379 m.192379 type:complete len:308 (+) comp14854_c0_seq3:178-1101(+)